MANSGGERISGRIPLSEAVASLRGELLRAAYDKRNKQLWFKPAPIELTLQVAVTDSGKGGGGIKWWLIEATGEYSHQSVATQTVKLTLEPVVFDTHGAKQEFYIDARDSDTPLNDGAVGDFDLDART